MRKFDMPDHIRRHSVMVERVAHAIASDLLGTGHDVSIQKVTAGALLHDIAKMTSLSTGENHALRGKEICLENNLAEIADIVGEHIVLRNKTLGKGINEKEIVYYADKRVNHDKIVSLKERLAYLLERYADQKSEIADRIRENFSLCRRVEKKIFSGLSFSPDDLDRVVHGIGTLDDLQDKPIIEQGEKT